MIKIQEHLNRVDADEFLNNLALRLWNHLNKRFANDSDYQHYSLIKRLDRLVDQTDEPAYLVRYANNDNDFLNRQKLFFEYLQTDNYEKLKGLVISRPEELLIFRNEILNILQPSDLYEANENFGQTAFGTLLVKHLFIYDNFRKSSICPELVTEMNLQNAYCPYCNYTRVQVIDLTDEQNQEIVRRAYLDIDHFYPKSKNPFFAISFFNLIPSCHSCNSIEKGDKDFSLNTHTNPFHKSYNNNHVFEIDDDYILNGISASLTIRRVSPQDDFMDRDLHLTQRYEQTYMEAVNELIQQYMDYQHYRESPDFFQDYINVVTQRVPKSINDIIKKEAGKMFRDIFTKIDVFDIM